MAIGKRDFFNRFFFSKLATPINFTDLFLFLIHLVNDKYVISRSCFWENINAPKDECINNNTPSYIKTEFCETCDTDGCNGAAQYGPVALLVAIPVAITKILLL